MSSGPDYSESAQIQADATKEAAKIQAQSQADALALQDKMFNKQQEYLKQQDEYNKGNYQPYIDAGKQGLNSLLGAVNDPGSWLNKSFSQDDLKQDDGYQFRLQEGNTALNKSLAAGSGLLSGAALKAASQYNQGMASEEYGNAYARFTNDKNNRYTQLTNLTGLGLSGASGGAQIQTGTQLSNVAGQYGSNVGNIMTNGANAQSNLVLANAQQQAQYKMMGQQGGNWLGGAASGAAMGSQFGPWGAVAGGVLGGLGSLL